MIRARLILAIGLLLSGLACLLYHWIGFDDIGAGMASLLAGWLSAEIVRPGPDAVDRAAQQRKAG